MNRRKFITALATLAAAVGIVKPSEAAIAPDNPWAYFKEIDPILEKNGISISGRMVEQTNTFDRWIDKANYKLKTKAVYNYTWQVYIQQDNSIIPALELYKHYNGDRPWTVKSLSTEPRIMYNLTLEEAMAELHKRGQGHDDWFHKAPPSSGYGDTWKGEA